MHTQVAVVGVEVEIEEEKKALIVEKNSSEYVRFARVGLSHLVVAVNIDVVIVVAAHARNKVVVVAVLFDLVVFIAVVADDLG